MYRPLLSLLMTSTLALPAPAATQTKRTRKKTRGPAAVEATVSTAAAAPPSTPALPQMLLVRAGLTLSQEAIDVRSPNGSASMQTQMQGMNVSVLRSVPFTRPRWSYVYGGDLLLGVIKGKADGVDVKDQVKGQPYYGLAFTPGLTYITSPVSRVALVVPVTYRQINWKVGSEGFDPDRGTSFSIGLTGLYENRFTIRSSMILSATYQHLWQSTSFGVAYQRRLR